MTSAYVPIDSDTGLIDADVIVPSDLQPGPHTLGWMCAADDMAFGAHDERVPFMVLGPVPTDPPTTPPAGSAGSDGAPELPASKDAVEGTLAETGLPSPAPVWLPSASSPLSAPRSRCSHVVVRARAWTTH